MVSRHSRVRALIAVLVFTFAACTAAGASAQTIAPTAPVLWTAPAGVDLSPLDAIACPTKTLCVAIDRAGAVVTSTDPAATASVWQAADVDPGNELTGIACPSAALCVAVDAAGNVVTSTDPLGGAAAWQVARIDNGASEPDSDTAGGILLRGVSCPTTTLCVAVDADGDAFPSTDPTGGTTAWPTVQIDTNRRYACTRAGLACQPPLVGVACPSSAQCAAADFSGNLLTSTAPTADAPWSSVSTDHHGIGSLWSLSCPTSTFCATVNGTGKDAITFAPSNSATRRTTDLGESAFGIWCRSRALCLASAETAGGLSVLLGSTNPGAAQPTWTASPLGGVDGVACPSVTLCFAVDDEGDVAAGVQTRQLTSDLRTELLSTTGLPSVATMTRSHADRLSFVSPIPAVTRLSWTVPGPGGSTATIATASHHYTAAGTATLVLRLTSAGRTLFRTARTKLTVQATVTFAASSGSLTRTRPLTLALGRRARQHAPRLPAGSRSRRTR